MGQTVLNGFDNKSCIFVVSPSLRVLSHLVVGITLSGCACSGLVLRRQPLDFYHWDWGVLQPAASESSQSSSAASSQIPNSPLFLSHPLPPASFSSGSPPPTSSMPSRPVAAPASVSPGPAISSLTATLLADLATTYASQTSSPSQPASSADVVAPPSDGVS